MKKKLYTYSILTLSILITSIIILDKINHSFSKVVTSTESPSLTSPNIPNTDISNNEFDSTSITNKIFELVGAESENLGLVYYDINSGNSININENLEFIGASTYKVLLNIVAYEAIKNNSINSSDEIIYDSSYYEEGTGVLQDTEITSINVQTLLDYSIMYSDNIATNMISSLFGGHDNVRALANDILGTSFGIDENLITPNDMFMALKFIYEHSTEVHYDHLLEIMSQTIFHERIDKYIPKEIVSHKIGSYDNYIHDVGIIKTENPYILVIYTKDLTNSEEVIAQISETIFKYQNGED